MSFWLLSTGDKTPQQFKKQDYLAMPDLNMDDFSSVLSKNAVKAVLLAHDADIPPESLEWQSDHIARFMLHIYEEDILCFVYLENHKFQWINFAEVTGPAYAVELKPGVFENRIPIRWFEEDASGLSLRPYMSEFLGTGPWPEAIEDAKLQQVLRNYLPLPGNKFANWKWLAALLLILQAFMMLKGAFQGLS